MSFFESRLRRLEDRGDPERCPACGRSLGAVIRVEYDKEGEGGQAIG